MDKSKLKYIDSEEKKVLSIRVGKSIYTAIEEMAEKQNKTVSDIVRQLLINALDMDKVSFVPGDILLKDSTSIFVVPVGEAGAIGTADIYSAIRKVST